MSHSTTTFFYKANETGRIVFTIKDENGTRREVDSETFAEYVDSSIKGNLRKLAAANEKVRVLREYAEAEECYFKFDGPAVCKAAEPYDGPCECWKLRLEALNAQRRAALEATKEGKE